MTRPREFRKSSVRRYLAWAALVALLLLPVCYFVWEYRESQLLARPMVPVLFEHADHDDVQCIDCHHNWVDDTGSGPCYLCHKTDPTVARDIEAMFHDFCRDCHIEKRLEGEDGGPPRECSVCHIPPRKHRYWEQ